MSARRMKARSWRWRGMYFVTLGASIAALLAGIAYATEGTGTGTGSGTGSTGSVNLSVNGPPATHACNYSTLMPGDSLETCTLSVTYSGSISAFVSLTVAIQSKPGPSGYRLYDGTPTSELTFSITDTGGHSFGVPMTGAAVTCPTSLTGAGYTCWTLPYELAAWYSGSTPNLTFVRNSTDTWTVTPAFPSTAGNNYQGATTNLILTAQAVQAPANPLPTGCTSSTIGTSCAPGGGFTWN